MHEKLICSYIYSSVYSYISSIGHIDDIVYLYNTIGLSEPLLHSICLLPFWVKDSIKSNTSTLSPKEISDLSHLSMANLLAWISYTLYDYIHDQKIDICRQSSMLSIANMCSQESITMCLQKTQGNTYLENIIRDTYKKMDMYYVKNDIQQLNKKDTDTQRIFINMCSRVYEKSIGIAVIPLIVYICEKNTIVDKEFVKLFDFFKHYLSARQLSDDLDDIHLDMNLDIQTPATYLTKLQYSSEYIHTMIRSQIDMHMRKAIECLYSIENFDAKLFQERFVRGC